VEVSDACAVSGILGGHFSVANGFKHSVAVLAAEKIAGMTRQVWWFAKSRMLPVPGKVHYVFNMRDLSRIIHVRSRVLCHTACLTHPTGHDPNSS